jgi:hypothetical protein
MNKINEIKLYYQNSCKKFILPSDFESLVNVVCSSFSLPRDHINFNYIDDEGDKIGIANQFDYNQLLKLYEFNPGLAGSQNGSSIKINVERSRSVSAETLNSPTTDSVLMLNSQIEDDLIPHGPLKNDKSSKEEFFLDFKIKLKNLLNKEIEDKIEDFKCKILNSIDMKINILFSQINFGNNFNNNWVNFNPQHGQGQVQAPLLNSLLPRRNKSCNNFKFTSSSPQEGNGSELNTVKEIKSNLILINTKSENEFSNIESITFSKEKENFDPHSRKVDLITEKEPEIKSKFKQKENISHHTSNLNFTSHSNFLHEKNPTSICEILHENIICKLCSKNISNISQSNSQSFYSCFHCDDVFYCSTCYNKNFSIKHSYNKISNYNTLSDHLLIHIKNPDREHLESFKSIMKIKRILETKRKFFRDKEKIISPIKGITGNTNLNVNLNQFQYDKYDINNFSNQNVTLDLDFKNLEIGFNSLTDKIFIELKNEKSDFDFLNVKINFINFSKMNIKTNSYLECLFDQSDIFGNKIVFNEVVKGYEEFELNMMFYNFKNKPSGFYISKWRLVREEENELINKKLINIPSNTSSTTSLHHKSKILSNSNSYTYSTLTFIFHLKSNLLDDELFNVDILKNEKFSNMPLQTRDRNIKTGEKSVPLSDMYSEIIKNYSDKKI